jgi:hypothetical protein
MFDDLLSSVQEAQNGARIVEAFQVPSSAEIRKNLSVPDMRPGLFDVTIEAWLKRISLWGSVEIEHYDPELKRKRKLSTREFIRKVTEPNFMKEFGKWSIDEIDVNKIVIYRDYVGLNGKKYREKFFVTIDLKKELKQALKR